MTIANEPFSAQHTAILSRLEYTQQKDGKTHFYPKEEFAKALDSFENLPILYTSRHPKTGFRGRTVEEVIQEVGGRIVGFSGKGEINSIGSPKLQTVLNITDSDLNSRILNGEISISPGFWYSAPDYGSLKNIVGDHILLYDRASQIPQGDVAAMIVNQSTESENPETAYYGFSEGYLQTGENMSENPTELESVLQILKTNQDELNGKILDKDAAILKLNQNLEEKDKEIQGKVKDIEAKDAEILKLNQDLAAKDTRIQELETQIKNEAEQKLKNQQDEFWNSLYEGTREKFSDRKEELLDPEKSIKLNQDILNFERSLEKPVLKNAEGNQNLKGNQGEPEVRSTAFDPYKGVMV